MQKRKRQNREAQRAFRERKEKRISDLEDELLQLKSEVDILRQSNISLLQQLRLRTECGLPRGLPSGTLDVCATKAGQDLDLLATDEDNCT